MPFFWFCAQNLKSLFICRSKISTKSRKAVQKVERQYRKPKRRTESSTIIFAVQTAEKQYCPAKSSTVGSTNHTLQNYDVEDDQDSEYEFEIRISVLDLLDFGGPNMMRLGDAVWKAGHIISVGVTSTVGSSNYKLEGVCLQTSHPTDDPQIINITTADEFKKWQCFCSCKAGLGSKCKHIYAILLHIHQQRKLRLLTCTNQKQKWGKLAKAAGAAVLKPERIRKLQEFLNVASKTYSKTEDEMLQSRHKLSDSKSSVAIFKKRCVDAEDVVNVPNYTENGTEDVKGILKRRFRLKVFIFDGCMKNVLISFYNKVVN